MASARQLLLGHSIQLLALGALEPCCRQASANEVLAQGGWLLFNPQLLSLQFPIPGRIFCLLHRTTAWRTHRRGEERHGSLHWNEPSARCTLVGTLPMSSHVGHLWQTLSFKQLVLTANPDKPENSHSVMFNGNDALS